MTLCRTTGIDMIDWVRVILSSAWALVNLKYWLISRITPDTPASRHAQLYLSVDLCYSRSQTLRSSWWNSMKEQRGVSHTAILGHVGKLMWRSPLRFAHTVSVWERPPRCLIRYIIRETAGRGCGQLTRGCRGRISCDFLEGLGFGLWDMFRSHVLSFIRYPSGGRNKFSE